MAAVPRTLSATKLQTLLRSQQTVIVDVRTDAEYYHEHIPGSFHIPLALLPEYAPRFSSLQKHVTFICRSGKRANEACGLVHSKGLSNAAVLEGGLQAWIEANGETVKSSSWSLERQVRAVAGSIVLVSAVLALTVAPSWAIVSAAVGAGLLFAGITDTCGMALVLARMPWNTRRTDAAREYERLRG